MEDWAAGGHPESAEHGHSLLEFRPTSSERKMVARKLAGLLLEHDHPGGAPGAEEQPLSAIVSKTDFEPEHVAVKRLSPLELSYGNRNLVDTSDQHRSPPRRGTHVP